MRFTIRFLNADQSGSEGREGEIELAGYAERFMADVSFWTEAAYESQWLEAAQRLVDGQTACFITDIHDFTESDLVGCWVGYPEADSVYFQETMLKTEAIRQLRPSEFHSAVRPRALRNLDGEEISEWSVPRSAVTEFVKSNQKTSY